MRKYHRPYRIKRKKSMIKKHSFWFFLFLIIFFLSSFYFLFFSPFFLIKNVLIFGGEKIKEETIRSFLEEKFGEKIFLFSKRNIFFLSSQEIRKKILEKIPKIEEVIVKKKFPNTLILEIKERKMIALFCQQENCFSLDERGIVFETTEEKNLLKIFNPTISSFVLGQNLINEEMLNQILSWTKKLREIENIQIESVVLFSQNKIILKTKEEWEIFIDPQEDLEWQLEKLRIVLKEVITPEKRGKLEYIDLRFGNFANPKYKK